MANRRRTSRGSGGGGIFGKGIWALLILALVFAWFKIPTPPGTPADVWSNAVAKSNSVKAWVQSITSGDFKFPEPGTAGGGGTTPGAQPGNIPSTVTPETKNEATASLQGIRIANAENVNYNRDDWKHWSSAGSSCWDTREAVLLRDAEAGSVVMLDSSKKETTDPSKACSIKSGKWTDPYSGKVFTDPSKLDVDHMIPLSFAARHGGQAWDAGKKETYANNMAYGHHLIAVSAAENRSKGDKGPSEYQPKILKCQYAVDWVNVAKAWDISITQADKTALESMLATC